MIFVIVITIAIGLIFILSAVIRWQRARKVRFAFEDRDTYLFLSVERLIGSDDSVIVTMRALREALRLKLASGYVRLLVETSELIIPNAPSFWLLVGALGPALVDGGVKVAIVCKGRRVRRYFMESGFVDTFPSQSKAMAFLRSAEPARSTSLDSEWVESLLSGERRPTMAEVKRVRRASRSASATASK